MKIENKFKLGFNLLFILIIFSYAVISFPNYYPFPQITGSLISKTLEYFGIPTYHYKDYVIVFIKDYNYAIQLSAECSGIILFMMFLVVVFIIPEYSIKQKLFAVPFVILLFFINALRIIIGIILSREFGSNILVIFHDTVGQAIIFFAVITSFIVWLKVTKSFPHEENYKDEMNY